jgi:cytochrome P450
VFRSDPQSSAAGPADLSEPIRRPPAVAAPRLIQTVRFNRRQIEFVFGARQQLGEVFEMRAGLPSGAVVTCHPDHARSLFTADPELVPSLTAESPLRPVVGGSSVLTANGKRHLRQRRLLLPPFHGDAVAQYERMITDASEASIDRWPLNRPFALAPRMQAITLRVIMTGIFGVQGDPRTGSAEHRLAGAVKRLLASSRLPLAGLVELMNMGRPEPTGIMRVTMGLLDSAVYPVIEQRRREHETVQRADILSLLLDAESEDGEALSDRELRDELLTLVLAGFETTANSLAWAWERLIRTADAYERLRASVCAGGAEGEELVEATIIEAMRSRPVIPIIGRRVTVPWRLGDYVVPAGSAVAVSILLLHHREDLYPDAFAFRPERWIGRKPGAYEWIPFGGGTRRCLGAALAMAEQRIVLASMARRLHIVAERAEPERAQHRNVTMIPARGASVILRSRRAG